MKDKHGIEIEVGDKVLHSFYGQGVVRCAFPCSYFAIWKDCHESSKTEECTCQEAVEIIKKANTNDLYESALDSVNTLVICLCSGGYEPRSQRDIELSNDLQKLLEKHNRSN